ncbi:outer envelope pore protein 16-3, chloroplastic/mitochondrial-like [Raphanus sativus]|uniref:Outer envelope pore protein 16-3, chloroplastic/mitochondrial-like n=1 Tax=Raphanus sativus TaxID=3726 RepID=A0A9W3DJM0_RAPSA|nr:outer envelope pore protein 16-3, chloroplastic/mitochondrial-like [Raphanus sativus]
MGTHRLTFVAIGGVYIGVEQVVQNYSAKRDFFNGAIGGFVAGASVLGYRQISMIYQKFQDFVDIGVCSVNPQDIIKELPNNDSCWCNSSCYLCFDLLWRSDRIDNNINYYPYTPVEKRAQVDA